MKIRRTTADALFSIYIRNRDKVCRGCGKSGSLECAHIYSRRHWATRHDPENAIALCFGCHRRFTEDPLEFARWCQMMFGKEAMDKLFVRAHLVSHKSKHDEALRVIALKQMVKAQSVLI